MCNDPYKRALSIILANSAVHKNPMSSGRTSLQTIDEAIIAFEASVKSTEHIYSISKRQLHEVQGVQGLLFPNHPNKTQLDQHTSVFQNIVRLIEIHLQELARRKNYLLDLRIALSSEIGKLQPNLALIKGYMGSFDVLHKQTHESSMLFGSRYFALVKSADPDFARGILERQRARGSVFEKVYDLFEEKTG
jgi:hypothetical protein